MLAFILATVLAPQASTLQAVAPMPSKPLETVVSAGHIPQLIEVKFRRDSGARIRNGAFGGGVELAQVNAVLLELGAAPRRMFMQSEDTLTSWRETGEARSGRALQDLNLFYFVDVAAGQSVAECCDALNELGVVDLAWPAPSGDDPVWRTLATPNFEPLQDYKDAAPVGIDATYGNRFSGGLGQGITIVDCETGWTHDHEDLGHNIQDKYVGFNPSNTPWDHGTAVMGEMLGGDNGFGVKGICYEAQGLLSTHSPIGGPQNIPGSIANGVAAVGIGDFVVIEIQCYGGSPGPFPCELDPATFATVQTATANGIHVFAAGGNGGHNLDSAAYGGVFDLAVKDSGAVIVGASDGASLDTADFSNYGSRVTSNGWGRDVVTTAYGDLSSGPATVEYTDSFSGTSSATPIVTGAGAVLAGIWREAYGANLAPLELRSWLANHGTPQGAGGSIGTRPDIRATVRAMEIPEIELLGTPAPGASIDVTSWGTPGDLYFLAASPPIPGAPAYLQPYGFAYLDLATAFFLPTTGVLGPAGFTTDSYTIPPSPSLSGVSLGLQGVQVFLTKPGTGSFSNFVHIRIQ